MRSIGASNSPWMLIPMSVTPCRRRAVWTGKLDLPCGSPKLCGGTSRYEFGIITAFSRPSSFTTLIRRAWSRTATDCVLPRWRGRTLRLRPLPHRCRSRRVPQPCQRREFLRSIVPLRCCIIAGSTTQDGQQKTDSKDLGYLLSAISRRTRGTGCPPAPQN